MTKYLAAALAVAGAAWFAAPAPANAATHIDGVTKATQTDLSAAHRHHRYYRRHYRHYRARVYTAPRYYGYYGPTYYYRPYARPAPLFFGIGGYW